MMQPSVTSGAVAKPNSSAPRIAAITTSRPGLEAAVGLQHDAAAQVVEHQRLVRFGDAQFPRQAGVLDARERRSAGAARVAGNENVIGKALGHAGRDRADADFRHELHAHARRRIAVLQIVDQLLEILDRINVVMRRRADEADAGRRVANAGDVGVDLAAGQLAAFARLRALRNLDLQLVGVGQIPDRDAEPAGRDLLDRRPLRVAVGQRLEPLGVFAAFARVALAAEPIHRDGQRFVRFGRDRAEAHRAGAESLHDILGRHHFVERNRAAVRAGLELQQAAQCAAGLRVAVRMIGKAAIGIDAVVARGHLQVGDRRRIPHVPLAVGPPVKLARVRQHGQPIDRPARDSRARAAAALPRPAR